ncbi:unnamed protein product, partial [Prorocentrum cordatum]
VLGDSPKEASLRVARETLISETHAIKEKIVRGKPFAGQLHHYTERERLDAAIADTEKVFAGLDADIQELEGSLQAMVPALDLSAEALGDILKGLGADAALSGSVTSCFASLRELANKNQQQRDEARDDGTQPPAEARGSAAGPSMPTPERQAEAQARAVPMDTDDIEELRSFLQASI